MNNIYKIYDNSALKLVYTIRTTKNAIQSLLPSNIEEASSMFFSKNSMISYSNQMQQDSNIKFSAILQRKVIKLCESNKDFSYKQPVFFLLCNEIFTLNPKVLIYQKGKNNLNLNCEVTALTQEICYGKSNKIIVCRHIAYGYATASFKLNEIDSKEKLQDHWFFQKDYERYYCYYFPAEGYYFQSKDIGKALQYIAKKLLLEKFDGYKSYLLYSSSHAMAIRIKFNKTYWKIKFYDPNKTIVEKIIIIQSIDDISLLTANDLQLFYYLTELDALCLLSTDTQKNQLNCKVHIYGNKKKLQLLMEKRGHYHATDSRLSSKNDLMFALVNNQSNQAKYFFSKLKEYDFTALDVITLNQPAISAFKLCLIKGNIAAMKVYLSFILNSATKIWYKLGRVGKLVYLPIKFNQVATTVVYMKTIMASDKLSITDKFNFIDSPLLLELPYINNYNENKALAAFTRIIQQSDFSLLQKKKLLSN